VHRTRVDPAFTFGVSLVISIALWLPTLRGTINGDIEITDAGIRYLLALALAWAAVFGVSSLVALHASRPRTSSFVPPDEGVRAAIPSRRTTELPRAVEADDDAADSDAA
jgi:hypothetical protein